LPESRHERRGGKGKGRKNKNDQRNTLEHENCQVGEPTNLRHWLIPPADLIGNFMPTNGGCYWKVPERVEKGRACCSVSRDRSGSRINVRVRPGLFRGSAETSDAFTQNVKRSRLNPSAILPIPVT
jgi:hypothetical protein